MKDLSQSEKLERLLRYHRQNVFDEDARKADRHERALKRLKRTKTARAIFDQRRAHAEHIASERLLRLYA